MTKTLMRASLLMAATALPFAPALAQGKPATAQGTPQRSAELPAGLAKNIDRGVPGVLRALVRTLGSKSRLQDRPTSP